MYSIYRLPFMTFEEWLNEPIASGNLEKSYSHSDQKELYLHYTNQYYDTSCGCKFCVESQEC